MKLETGRCRGEAGALVLHEDEGGGTARPIAEKVEEHCNVVKAGNIGYSHREDGHCDGESSLKRINHI